MNTLCFCHTLLWVLLLAHLCFHLAASIFPHEAPSIFRNGREAHAAFRE